MAPPLARTGIPTLYDPRKATSSNPEEEKAIFKAAAAMGKSDSAFINNGIDYNVRVSEPSAGALENRPARPWSEVPKRE